MVQIFIHKANYYLCFQISYMQYNLSLLAFLFSLYSFAQKKEGNKPTSVSNNAQFVNPFIGTGGHGHTYPGCTMPFGMVQLSPDTRIDGSWDGCSGYHYSDSIIYGFSHTHLNGTGCSDYGDIALMPANGIVNFKSLSYAANLIIKMKQQWLVIIV
jgi:putative alpha-1,2-mannosidase